MSRVRTTIVIDYSLDFNLQVLQLQRTATGSKTTKNELIVEGIKLLLEKNGYPTDKIFDLNLKK